MTKTQYKRTAVASMFQNRISQNTKCAERNSFCRKGHICDWILETDQIVTLGLFHFLAQLIAILIQPIHSAITRID